VDLLLTLSATRLAALVRAGEVRSREVVEAHIARVRAVNPTVNALVAERFDAARREADAADARRRDEGPDGLPPLHGVPCTIKECFAVDGMPNTSGLVARRGLRAGRDATAVARLRAAGAIVLGFSNTPELCMWMETHNRVYGRTNNPYDPRRIVGGSSGGEGAIVATGGSPFGLGSDIGGSIRMPAFFNGVFGHKPSGGLVPGTGQFPMAVGDAGRKLATGPLARRAEDLWPLLQALAGPDGEDAACRPFTLGDPASVDWRRITVHDFAGDELLRVHPELRAAQERAAAYFRNLGARVVRTALPEVRRVFEVWSAILHAAGDAPLSRILGGDTPLRPWRELGNWARRSSPHMLPTIVLAILEPLADKTPGRNRALLVRGDAMRRALHEAIGPEGIVLFPSFPSPAPRHGAPLLRPFHFVFTAVFNITECPATQVPLGLGREGLPLGLQVAAVPGNDHLTIAAAQALERAFGGWVPPRGIPA
jgi:fatty acid amide hydrolase 2